MLGYDLAEGKDLKFNLLCRKRVAAITPEYYGKA
jgi:hypothetical protein